jgi:hypothetical protein
MAEPERIDLAVAACDDRGRCGEGIAGLDLDLIQEADVKIVAAAQIEFLL